MHIDSYSFGKMKVDGKVYNKDLIIFPEKVRAGWWRKDGHSLAMEDLEEVIAYKPDVLVVGRGAMGAMKIPDETKSALESVPLKLIEGHTSSAMKMFNERIKSGEKVVGAFHLTC